MKTCINKIPDFLKRNTLAILNFLKKKAPAIPGFLKRNAFYPIAILAFFILDYQLRILVRPKVANDFVFNYVFPSLFTIGWSSLFLYISVVFLPKRWGRILYLTVGGLFLILAFSEYVYFQIFNQFFRMSSIGLAGEGNNYLGYALSYADLRLAFFTFLSAVCFGLTAILWKKPEKTGKITKICAVIPVIFLVGLHLYLQPALFHESDQEWDAWRNPRIVYDQFTDPNKCMDISGICHFTFRDLYKTYIAGSEFTEENYEQVDKFIEKRAAEYSPNEYTGAFEGKNVIAVMLEGIDDWMISEKYTPVMKYMMDNGINFSNYYAPHFGTGLTLGSEFCFHTGYYTPTSGTSPVNYTGNYFPYALPNLFKEKGYSVNSFHYNHSEFYNRGSLHQTLGYEKYHSFMDYGLSEEEVMSDSNILKHDRIFNDIVKDEPFFSFVITYSGHVPYTFDDTKLALAKKNHPELIDKKMDLETNNCHILARDTDDFFRMLLEKLNECGKLEDTVILAFTDHNAYGFSDQEKLKQYSIEAGCENVHRVPAFIFNYGGEPLEISKPCKTADWAPTVVNLFNLENHHCYLGYDIFSPNYSGFVYFGNYGWISDTWVHDRAVPERPQDKEKNYQGRLIVKELLIMNDIIVSGDYFAERR